MRQLMRCLLSQSSETRIHQGLFLMRVGIGILTFLHGWPKMIGGIPMWEELGTFVHPLGIYFLPVMWGFLGACIEFFGGLTLIFGLGTRIASIFLTLMMFVATAWHLNHGDSFNIYSLPLTLIVVYISFIITGSGIYSLDNLYWKE